MTANCKKVPKSKQKKRTRVTDKRWAVFWKSLAENTGLSIAEHGRRAGFAENYVTTGHFYEHVNARKSKFDKIMDKLGLTDEYLLEKIKGGMNKKKTVFLKKAEMPHPEKKKGKIFLYDPMDMDDNQIQFNYAELALKLKGKLINKVQHEVVEDDQGDVVLADLSKSQLKAIEKIMTGKKEKKGKK